jgi:hypothetical protein
VERIGGAGGRRRRLESASGGGERREPSAGTGKIPAERDNTAAIRFFRETAASDWALEPAHLPSRLRPMMASQLLDWRRADIREKLLGEFEPIHSRERQFKEVRSHSRIGTAITLSFLSHFAHKRVASFSLVFEQFVVVFCLSRIWKMKTNRGTSWKRQANLHAETDSLAGR